MKRLLLVPLALASSSALLVAACSSSDGSPAADGSTGVDADAGADAGPTGPSPGSARSGTRLKIVRYQAPGDAYAVPKLRDTELGPCIPTQTADGAVRCVPEARTGFGSADASCTQPVAVDVGGCGSKYAVTNEPASFDTKTCDLAVTNRMRVFEVGAPSPVTTVYYDDGAKCVASEVPAGTKVFAATELAPSKMVALDAKDEAIGRVAVRLMTSEDGLRLPLGLVDAASAKACSLLRASDGQDPKPGDVASLACVPGVAATASTGAPRWEDASCTKLAGAVREHPCMRAPSFVRVAQGSAECSPTQLHAVGSQLAGSFVGAPDACQAAPADNSDPQTLWAVGEPLALGSFATVERTLVGTAALRSTAYVVDGKTVLDGFAPAFVRGDDLCGPVRIGDDTYCLPLGVAMLPENAPAAAFTDDACTKPAVTYPALCATKPTFVVTLALPDACSGQIAVTRLYEVGTPTTILYEKVDGVCQPKLGVPNGAYFELGPERKVADALVRLESKEL